MVYEIGRREPFLDQVKKGKDGRPGVSLDWFNMLYQVLLGQEKGPRFGSFVAVYGVTNAVAMIDGALARSSFTRGVAQNAETRGPVRCPLYGERATALRQIGMAGPPQFQPRPRRIALHCLDNSRSSLRRGAGNTARGERHAVQGFAEIAR